MQVIKLMGLCSATVIVTSCSSTSPKEGGRSSNAVRTNQQLALAIIETNQNGTLEYSDKLYRVVESAAAVFETTDWVNIHVTKPFVGDVSISAFETIIPRLEPPRSKTAVIIMPQLGPPVTSEKPSADEIVIRLVDDLRRADFKNISLFARAHGIILLDAYPNGLPTKEEAARRKATMLDFLASPAVK